jgi:hypothetical protein
MIDETESAQAFSRAAVCNRKAYPIEVTKALTHLQKSRFLLIEYQVPRQHD